MPFHARPGSDECFQGTRAPTVWACLESENRVRREGGARQPCGQRLGDDAEVRPLLPGPVSALFL